MIPANDITGLILAGGRSRRMQSVNRAGVDKGLLVVAGKPLIAHAVQPLQGHVSCVLISANRNTEHYGSYGTVMVDDPCYPPYSGPLAGLASALHASVTSWLVVLPVDVAGVPPDFVERMSLHAAQVGSGLVYAKCGSHEHPLCAMMRTSLKESLHTFLEKGGRRVFEWMARQNAQVVHFPETPHSFVNINTPEDLWRHPTMPQHLPGGDPAS